MKHLIVLNAKAGQSKDFEAFKKNVEKSFEGLDYEIHLTSGPRTVIGFLHQYLDKNKDQTVRVYACGGDGTVHEVANGLVGHPNAELAVLAVGTGNDFVKIYSPKQDYDSIVKEQMGAKRFQSFDKLINGKVEEIDLSKVTSDDMDTPWYSINVINFGFDAIVGIKGNENKNKGIKNPYGPAAIIPAILGGRFNNIIVKADGEQLNKKKMLLASLAQGQFVGAMYRASPKSDNKDGYIDVMLLKCMSLATLMIKFFGPYTRGEHLDRPKLMKKIVFRRAKEIEIIGKKEVAICVDGEIVRSKQFKVEVMPKALKFVVPAE